jgi:hypothetical protein
MVGGWIFNRPHKHTMSNEAWWVSRPTTLLIDDNECRFSPASHKSPSPLANVETRFMRAGQNFDDLHAFLSFGALALGRSPILLYAV